MTFLPPNQQRQSSEGSKYLKQNKNNKRWHTKPFHHIFYCDEEFLLLLLWVCVIISEVTQAIVCLHNQNTMYSKYHFILY